MKESTKDLLPLQMRELVAVTGISDGMKGTPAQAGRLTTPLMSDDCNQLGAHSLIKNVLILVLMKNYSSLKSID